MVALVWFVLVLLSVSRTYFVSDYSLYISHCHLLLLLLLLRRRLVSCMTMRKRLEGSKVARIGCGAECVCVCVCMKCTCLTGA